jgi:adenylate cyclase
MKKWTRLGIYLLTITLVGLVGLGSYLGFFTLPELRTYDTLKRLSPKEIGDRRIVIVSISENDINYIGKWPITDRDLARLLTNIRGQQPTVIGLDIYRNIPVDPGNQELLDIFANTPNLIGIAKIISDTVQPPAILESTGRIGVSDFVLDIDGKIRRSLLFALNHESLSIKLAEMYLAKQGISFNPDANDLNKLQLGKTTFYPLTGNEGEYDAELTDGYQIMLNYRGELADFETVSLTDILENRISQDLFRDRIVLIGTIAPSLNDKHQTPYPNFMPGVVVHANSVSQLISAAIDGRPLVQATSKPFNYLWLCLWAIAGAVCGTAFNRNLQLATVCLLLGFGIIAIVSYYAFQIGWWLPVVTPMLSFLTVAIAIVIWELGRYLRISYKQLENYAAELEQKVSDRTRELQQANLELSRLALVDGLTQISNRRCFDDYLFKEWQRHLREQQPIALILIDIDYFKRYNDHYGHQGGDECLLRVAQAINQTAQRPTDLVARYGGEEFAVVLPNTYIKGAMNFAESIQRAIAKLAIPHAQSDVSAYVTLSMGVTSLVPTLTTSPEQLIAHADQGLYAAKAQGRNCAVSILPS